MTVVVPILCDLPSLRPKQSELYLRGLRYCPNCNEVKCVSLFGKAKGNTQGLSTYCLYCRNKRAKQQRLLVRDIPSWSRTSSVRIRARCLWKQWPCDLDPDYISRIFPKDYVCPVLGLTMQFRTSKYINDNNPSIDRFYPERGYIKGNVAVISWRANRIKNNASPDDLAKLSAWASMVIRASDSTVTGLTNAS